jgi:hypothetical protein
LAARSHLQNELTQITTPADPNQQQNSMLAARTLTIERSASPMAAPMVDPVMPTMPSKSAKAPVQATDPTTDSGSEQNLESLACEQASRLNADKKPTTRDVYFAELHRGPALEGISQLAVDSPGSFSLRRALVGKS